MKSPTQIEADIRKRLERTWASDITGETASWPHQFPLNPPASKAALESQWDTVRAWGRTLADWEQTHNVETEIVRAGRQVFTTPQRIPSHARVETMKAAANTLDRSTTGEWSTRLNRAHERTTSIREQFPNATGITRILRDTDTWTDTDFGLLLTVADWFRNNHTSAAGLTPRQVPVPGLHAKWLNTSHQHVLNLTGLLSLGLADRHPPRIHFTYLDPQHRANGGRWHDSATVGDHFGPAYTPRVVLISENKDTAINFPELPGGIAVEGEGFGGKSAATYPWLVDAEHVIYWGDIDRHGYEILNNWREDGVPVRSILMDQTTYNAYEKYGTNTDKTGNAIGPGERKALPALTEAERAVYNHLTDPAATTNRRIEQERIPLTVALNAVIEATEPETMPAGNVPKEHTRNAT